MSTGTLDTKPRATLPILAELVERSRALFLGKRYRPELHYMRGPGPKAMAKAAIQARPSADE